MSTFNATSILADLDRALSGAEDIQRSIRERDQAAQQILRNLRACFNKASKDGGSRIPSYLSTAILNACAMVRE